MAQKKSKKDKKKSIIKAIADLEPRKLKADTLTNNQGLINPTLLKKKKEFLKKKLGARYNTMSQQQINQLLKIKPKN